MNTRELISKLAEEQKSPCVTISFNTHRTFPDNQQDEIRLKNLVKEAEDRLLSEFSKREIADLLANLQQVRDEYTRDQNLESIHIFVSSELIEVKRSSWPLSRGEGVFIDDTFAIRPLIKDYNRTKSYYVLSLNQKDVRLFELENESIVREIKNDDFPFTEANYNLTHLEANNDHRKLESKVKEFYNLVDKSVQRAIQDIDAAVLVIATEANFSYLKQVADYEKMYLGILSTALVQVSETDLGIAAWEFMKGELQEQRTAAIEEIEEAVAQGNVLTDLQEIYEAARTGRGDLLIVHQDYQQAALIDENHQLELVDDPTTLHAVDDIVSMIAWDVISKNGRTVFTTQERVKDLGDIVLKTRY